MSTRYRAGAAFAAALVVCVGASGAVAEVVHFTAKLDGAQETPPRATLGKGTAQVTLDTTTRQLGWTITYSGLSGPATAAHFHGPAAPGASADAVVPITGNLASPIKGSAALSDAQIGDLRGGLWYVNIHTAKYPPGEIRGQVQQAK